ncbi:hypothetical protein HED49_08275 [Ochrobactrum daejeonense]|nr:hypothetical protein [Brucella daejeonensis]
MSMKRRRVYDLTHRYLLGVAEDDEQSTDLRLEALKLLRKVEARRVTPPLRLRV